MYMRGKSKPNTGAQFFGIESYPDLKKLFAYKRPKKAQMTYRFAK